MRIAVRFARSLPEVRRREGRAWKTAGRCIQGIWASDRRLQLMQGTVGAGAARPGVGPRRRALLIQGTLRQLRLSAGLEGTTRPQGMGVDQSEHRSQRRFLLP